MIEVKNLTKRYGSKTAVDNISFSVKKGEVLGFLGPNGAGKSTTMNMLTGYVSSSSGSIIINGFDILENPNEVKKCVGYLPEQPPLYTEMTVDEFLDFVFDLKRATLNRNEHLSEIKEMTKISDVSGRKIKNLSKGYRQRVGLACALCGAPDILILDEPTVGLDPLQIIEVRSLISSLAKDRTVIFSSHILAEVSEICDRVMIINNGKIIAEGSSQELKTAASQKTLTYVVQIGGSAEKTTNTLREIDGVIEVTVTDEQTGECYAEVTASKDIRAEMFKILSENNLPLLSSKEKEVSLEDLFLNIVGKEKK